MRALGALASVVVLMLLFAWMMWWLDGGGERRAERKASERRLKAEQKYVAVDAQAIRLLDRALADPMYRQSTEWEDQAKALVDDYYGKGLKR